MFGFEREGERAAAFNLAGAHLSKHAQLIELSRTCGSLLMPLVQRSAAFNSIDTARLSRSPRRAPYASLTAARTSSCSTQRRSPGQRSGVARLFDGFFRPPPCAPFASVCASGVRLRIASKLASVVMLKNGELQLEGVSLHKLPHATYEIDPEHIRSVYNEMDLNGDGFVDRDELKGLLNALGLPCSANSFYVTYARSRLVTSCL